MSPLGPIRASPAALELERSHFKYVNKYFTCDCDDATKKTGTSRNWGVITGRPVESGLGDFALTCWGLAREEAEKLVRKMNGLQTAKPTRKSP